MKNKEDSCQNSFHYEEQRRFVEEQRRFVEEQRRFVEELLNYEPIDRTSKFRNSTGYVLHWSVGARGW
jgi:hypothetical protein